MIDLDNCTILLTGATGSFGQAFTRRVRELHPGALIRLFSRDELKQSDMHAQLGDRQLRYLIGDVRDKDRLLRAAQGCDLIVHAAAMKQVTACEFNPFEAIRTNVEGTQNVIDAAIDAGVERVVGLSTDKAVNPVNLYGATKLCAEKILVQGNAYAAGSPTRLTCVRYGNVVGSRGSVIPLFRRQREEGQLTITDERMTRFWITLEAAVDFVLWAATAGIGGEIFVPKLPSMRVVDLADAMAPGVPREVTGIRPGEKLHEGLLTEDEIRHTVDIGDCYVVLPELHEWRNPPQWDGKPLPADFRYTSDSNERWVTPAELAALV